MILDAFCLHKLPQEGFLNFAQMKSGQAPKIQSKVLREKWYD